MALRLAPRARQRPSAIAAVVVLVLDLVVRVAGGGPYRGATVLLLLACGAVLLPLLPDELDRPALRLAVLPALVNSGQKLPYLVLAVLIAAIFAGGLLFCWLAAKNVLRRPLLESLRTE